MLNQLRFLIRNPGGCTIVILGSKLQYNKLIAALKELNAKIDLEKSSAEVYGGHKFTWFFHYFCPKTEYNRFKSVAFKEKITSVLYDPILAYRIERMLHRTMDYLDYKSSRHLVIMPILRVDFNRNVLKDWGL